MDYKEEKEFISFLFKEIQRRGIKYFKKDGIEIVGPATKSDIRDITRHKDESYVDYKGPKDPTTVDQAVDPYALREEERIMT